MTIILKEGDIVDCKLEFFGDGNIEGNLYRESNTNNYYFVPYDYELREIKGQYITCKKKTEYDDPIQIPISKKVNFNFSKPIKKEFEGD